MDEAVFFSGKYQVKSAQQQYYNLLLLKLLITSDIRIIKFAMHYRGDCGERFRLKKTGLKRRSLLF